MSACQREAVLELWAQGLGYEAIGERLRKDPGTIKVALSQARKQRDPRATYSDPRRMPEMVREAKKRGLTVNELTTQIFRAVVRHDLFAAVLDG